ncbi:CocE/NonD family hydrolase [Thermoactinospora rubra]|uniref:CocE/NonD family hydrolase n=1 Tax=Thermoactinospora rubra TaxID=1088767 RepID=UPI000A0F8DBB|nr:CocE/NonD family hydrolase [Thermoactinospora rubra]
MTVLREGLRTPGGLVCDAVLPAATGRWPVLAIRTPYGRSRHLAEAHGWARRGMAAVVQDVRGRHESPGEWRPYAHEHHDGPLFAAWLRDQPWCDGRVIAYGSSYAAHCALHMDADAIVAAVPALGPAETAREATGVPRLYSPVWWWSTYGACRTERPGLLDTRLAHDPLALHEPPARIPARLGLDLPGLEEAWRAPREPAICGRVPLLSLAGLYDPFLDAAVGLWRGWSGPAELVAGPWQHDLGLIHRERNGDRPLLHAEKVTRFVTRWVDRVLAGEEPSGATLAVESTRDWIGSLGGDALEVPLKGEGRFEADPADPFPSAMGPVDVSRPRADAVVAVSEPYEGVAAGRPRVTFQGHFPGHIQGRIQGHWVARLSEALPDGRAVQLGHAVGETTDLTLPTIVHRFAPGSRLRVEIAAHHFPLHVRHPHTDDDPLTATTLRPSVREVAGVRLTLETP